MGNDPHRQFFGVDEDVDLAAFQLLVDELRVKAQIRDTFGKYVDPRIVAGLIDNSPLAASDPSSSMTHLSATLASITTARHVAATVVPHIVDDRVSFQATNCATDLVEPPKRRLAIEPDRPRQSTTRLLLHRGTSQSGALAQGADHRAVYVADQYLSLRMRLHRSRYQRNQRIGVYCISSRAAKGAVARSRPYHSTTPI